MLVSVPCGSVLGGSGVMLGRFLAVFRGWCGGGYSSHVRG